MPFQPCPGIAQLEMVYADDTQVVENVYHFLKDGDWSHANLVSLCAAAQVWESSYAFDNRASQCSLFKLMARDLGSESGLIYETSVSPPIAGDGTAGTLPNNVTIALSHRTGLSGRSYRGRSYWVGLPRNFVAGQSLTAAAGTALITAMGHFKDTLEAAGSWKWVVLSRRHAGAPRAEGIGTEILETILVNFDMDSQRRRLPGRGA